MRIFDFIFSIFLLFLLLPLFLLIIVILKYSGEGEIFYLQERVGLSGKRFKIFKFATMLKNSPSLPGGTLTLEDDPRILPFGKFLRASKLNELPQLLNIVLGHMAFVGPRPLVEAGEELYSISDIEIIRSVRPGLTGMGSLILRDEEKIYAHRDNALDFYVSEIQPYKALLERFYVENKSLFLDLKIMIMTAVVVCVPSFDSSRFFKDLPPIPGSFLS